MGYKLLAAAVIEKALQVTKPPLSQKTRTASMKQSDFCGRSGLNY